mgnify:CR=1 FL=1
MDISKNDVFDKILDKLIINLEGLSHYLSVKGLVRCANPFFNAKILMQKGGYKNGRKIHTHDRKF